MKGVKRAFIWLLSSLLICVALPLPLAADILSTRTADGEYPVTPMVCVGNTYSTDHSTAVPTMARGTFTLSVQDPDVVTEYNPGQNVLGLGIAAGDTVHFSYRSSGNTLPTLADDPETTVAGISLGASVRHGAVLIFRKPEGNQEWSLAATAVDIWKDGGLPLDDLYACSAEDIRTGCAYRIVFAYATHSPNGYTRYTETYSVYLSLRESLVIIRNLADSPDSFPVDESSGIHQSILMAGSTLLDGSVTSAGFQVINYGNTGNQVTVSYEGTAFTDAYGSYTKPGTYRIRIKTVTGQITQQTVYICPPEEEARNFYFPSGDPIATEGNRFFSFGDYPVYLDHVTLLFNDTAGLPPLRGKLTRLDEESGQCIETVTLREDHASSVSISGKGLWIVELTNADTTLPGSYYQFRICFTVIADPGDYTLNRYMMTHSTSVSNLESQHYEVVLPSSGTGAIHVCFSRNCYEDAYEFAYQVEKRYARIDTLTYRGVTYSSNTALIAALNGATREHIRIACFDPRIQYPTVEQIDDILTYATDTDIWVFLSASHRAACRVRSMVVDPSFCFLSVPGQSDRIEARQRGSNKTVAVLPDIPIGDQLEDGIWVIAEIGALERRVTYEIVLMHSNRVSWRIQRLSDGSEWICSGTAINVWDTAIRISDIINDFDTQGIAVIQDQMQDHTESFALAQLSEITLYSGSWYIQFVDCQGNCCSVYVSIPDSFGLTGENSVLYGGETVSLDYSHAMVSSPTTDSANKGNSDIKTGCNSTVKGITGMSMIFNLALFVLKSTRTKHRN